QRSPSPQSIVEKLPDLPASLADNLRPTEVADVLMTKSPPPVHNPGVLPRISKAQACVKTYAGYVIFPLTVCMPSSDLIVTGEAAAIEAQTAPLRWSPSWQGARYYGLSKSSVARINARLFCRQSGGPWYAEVTTRESCDDAIPDQSSLDITG